MKALTVNALMNIGIPAGMKGFTYICDAMELFNTDPYYADGKICALYSDIAHKRTATATGVERAIRNAFETALKKGNPRHVEFYLDTANTQNSHLLRTLYLRLSQRNTPAAPAPVSVSTCSSQTCDLRRQIYQELLIQFSKDLEELLNTVPTADCRG